MQPEKWRMIAIIMLVISGLLYFQAAIHSVTNDDVVPSTDDSDTDWIVPYFMFGLFAISLISLILFIKKSKLGFYLSHIVSVYGVIVYGFVFAVFIMGIISGVLEFTFEMMISAFFWMTGIFVNNLLLLIAAWKSRPVLDMVK